VFVDTSGVVDVVMDVDHVEPGAVYGMNGNVQHGNGLEIFEEEGLLLFGVGGRFVADLGGGVLRNASGGDPE
jgi:hypothetical protein